MAVGGRMSGEGLGDDARPFLAAMADEGGRVVLSLPAYETFATPPRHFHSQRPGEAHALVLRDDAMGRR